MAGYILGTKSTQSQWFDGNGMRRNKTTVLVRDCYVVACKTVESDGYNAFVLGMQTKEPRNITKSFLGKTKKAGITTPLNFFKEVRIPDSLGATFVTEDGKTGFKIGDQFYSVGLKLSPATIFKAGDLISVTGTSKGKGFAGVVKRHNFRGGPRTHGQSDRERSPGSIGNRTIPGRVFKGKRMAGRMGAEQVTVQGLKIVEATDTQVVVQGLVPGSIKTLLFIKSQK
ncbi:MAG: 50S ribosomal protein L3 [Patescibacteria group bacterium]|jgi:large subunit ribosomal protein L3